MSSSAHQQPDGRAAADAIRKWFTEPKRQRRERPWSRLELEVRREFRDAQRWARR